jgi:DNA processing protein
MNYQEKIARLKLFYLSGISPAICRKIVDYYNNSVVDFWKDKIRLKFFPGIQGKITKSRLKIEDILQKCLILGESSYPYLLAQISDPPLILFYKGNIKYLSNQIIAIVGTRKYSEYGRRVVSEIGNMISQSGVTIVSGLAYGIDSFAHKSGLNYSGSTIAVMGTPLSNIYPAGNRYLFERIVKKGLVLSEQPDNYKNHKGIFAMRNRIIAGLAVATIVIEAPLKSGASITAKLAFDYGRSVYAVAGRLNDEKSVGCHNLIRDNIAKIYTDISEISKDLNIEFSDKQFEPIVQLPAQHGKVFAMINKKGRMGIDELKTSTGLDDSQLYAILAELEMQKIVAKDLTGNYTLVPLV